jgi:hypothetical protein
MNGYEKNIKTNLFLILTLFVLGCAHKADLNMETETPLKTSKQQQSPSPPEVQKPCDPTSVWIQATIETYNAAVLKTNGGRVGKNVTVDLARRNGNTIIMGYHVDSNTPEKIKIAIMQVDPCSHFFAVLPGIKFDIVVDGTTTTYNCGE